MIVASNNISSNKLKFICASASSFLLLLSFPPFNIWPVAFIAFIPFLFLLSQSNRHDAFFFSYIAGFIYFAGSIYWISHVSLFGCIFLICLYAFFWALFGLVGNIIIQRHKKEKTLSTIFSLALGLSALWVSVELMRSDIPVFGFPWNIL